MSTLFEWIHYSIDTPVNVSFMRWDLLLWCAAASMCLAAARPMKPIFEARFIAQIFAVTRFIFWRGIKWNDVKRTSGRRGRSKKCTKDVTGHRNVYLGVSGKHGILISKSENFGQKPVGRAASKLIHHSTYIGETGGRASANPRGKRQTFINCCFST